MGNIAGGDDVTNERRVAWANAAVTTFALCTDQATITVGAGAPRDATFNDDPESILTDLLADLQHWADAKGIDWEEAVMRADTHHAAELPEPGSVPKIRAVPDGREGYEGFFLPDRESLKAFIRATGQKKIHNFVVPGGMALGADHDVGGVLDDIDRAERVAVATGPAAAHNIGHSLALVMPPDDSPRYEGLPPRPQRLEMYDIGHLTEEDLEVVESLE